MYKKKHSEYRIRYYLQFQASAEDFGMCPRWRRGDYCMLTVVMVTGVSHL